MKPIKPESAVLPLIILLLAAALHYHRSSQSLDNARETAHSEWQAMMADPTVNFQLALESFDRYKKEFGATPEEAEQFRSWKRSVRANAELDGKITDPQVYLEELLAFRDNLPRPVVNEEERPPSFETPRSRAAGTHVSLQKPNKDNAGAWKSIGYHGNPDRSSHATGSGAAEGVTIDPNNPAIVYAVIRHGGLWKSTDYGNTYIPLTDYFYSPSITSLGIGTTNSEVLYLANGTLIWYSDDGGMSWEERTNEFSGWPEEIWVDPTDENRVIIASDKGLFLSTNAGMSWAKVLDGIYRELQVTDGWHTLGAAVDGTNGPAELFLSYDKGDTWVKKPITDQPDTVTKSYIAFCDTGSVDELIIYAYTVRNGNTPSIFTGLFKSNDRGETFTEVKAPGYDYPNGPVSLSGDSVNGYSELMDNYGSVNPSGTSSWVGEFWCDPTNPNNLVTMREKMWYSIDGGQTWRFGPSYGGAGWADRRYCTQNPTNDTLYICDDGGVWAIAFDKLFPYSGSGADFISKNGNIAASEGTNMAISTYNKEVFMTGGQDIGQVFQRDGISTHVHWADVYRGRISPVNDSIFWTGGYIASVDGDTVSVQLYNGVEPDHFDPLRIYGFTKAGVLYRTVKGQDAWQFSNWARETAKSSGGQNRATAKVEPVDLSSAGVEQWNGWTFEQSRANPELAFIGDERGRRLFKTENLSADAPTWTEVTGAPSLGRYRIATHPYNEKLIAIGTDNAVWISRDGGNSWSELEGFPASGTTNIFFDRNTQEGLYACNSMTVWYRDETLNNWIEFNRGLPLQKISEMKIAYYPDGDARLFVAKYGRSVWSTPLYSVLNKRPITADFTIHSQSRTAMPFYAGDQVKLNDLSMGDITGRTWTITGPDSISISGNDTVPQFELTTPGIYSVKLTATGSAGTNSVSKAGFITVKKKLLEIDSVPASGEGGAWYLGIKSLTINEQKYSSNGNTNLFYEDLTGHTPYMIESGDSMNVYIEPAYNDATWGNSYARVYLDSDNSGSFEEDEVIYAKDDGRLQGHTFTVAVPDEMPEETPVRIRVLVNRSSVITDAYMSQVSAGQAEDHVIIRKRATPTITVSAEAVSSDSLALTGTFANAGDVVDAGFIVTAFTPIPELTNPGRISVGNIGQSDFTGGKGDLPANRTYYVRSYVIDQYGTYYSEIDTIVPPVKTIPILETIVPSFNSQSNSWQLNGRIHGENNSVDSLWFEITTDGVLKSIPVTTISGVRDQWDSIAATLTDLKRYSSNSYRIVAKVDGELYRSATKTFNSEYGLYAYWNFDETGSTILDRSGNNRHATMGEGLTRANDDLGGSALLFDSVTDVASIGLGNLQPPFTLQFRVKKSAESSVNYSVLLDGNSRRVDLEVWNNTRRLGVAHPRTYDRASSITVPLDEWHTYTMVGTTDSVKIYTDGVFSETIYAPVFQLPLNRFGLSGASMLGLLDEVKVYNRELSENEITEAAKRFQTITFTAVADKRIGDEPFTLSAESSSGNEVTFSIIEGSELITLDIDEVTELLDTGLVTIRAVVEGDDTYLANSIDQQFRILPEEITSVVKPDDKGVLGRVSIAPNPARIGMDEGIHVTVPGNFTAGSLSIFDPTGGLVRKLHLRETENGLGRTWDLRNRSGVYVGTGAYMAIIRVETPDGSQKIVKQLIGVTQ